MYSFESDYLEGCHEKILEASTTNQQFVILENDQMNQLKEYVRFSFWEKYDDSHTVVRFASSWATTDEGIEELRRAVQKVFN